MNLRSKRSMIKLKLIALAVATLWFSATASAGLISSVQIEVRGIAYTANFLPLSSIIPPPNANPVLAGSFNWFWDGNRNGDFTDDGDADVFDFEPTFWKDFNGAQLARDAIILELGKTDGTMVTSFGLIDKFIVPSEAPQVFAYWAHTDFDRKLTDENPISGYFNRNTSEKRSTFVSFNQISQSVATPATLSLFGLGLAGLGWLRWKRT